MKNPLTFLLILLIPACKNGSNHLPILGHYSLQGNDTVYAAIPHFEALDQDSTPVSESIFNDKVTLVDFIFLSCPTICPKMTSELLRIYELDKSNSGLQFLSFTIDPENDGLDDLSNYAQNLRVNYPQWRFLRTPKDSVYALAIQGFYATAFPDSTAPGGIVHSAGIYLVDKNHHIRGVYDGTNPKETQRLIMDIKSLFSEYQMR